MGTVRYSIEAAAKIKRACEFYETLDQGLYKKAMLAITSSLSKLADRPKVGRPFVHNMNYRERFIPFGSSHFIALYRIDEMDGSVVVVALRHEREMGYESVSED